MARNRQIIPAGRSTPVARVAPVLAEQHRAEYRAMLTDELGPAVFNYTPSRDDGRPVGLVRLMLRPAGLFAIALTAMIAVLGIKLWREGVFDSFRQAHIQTVAKADKNWMLGDRLAPPPPEKIIDPVAQQPKPATDTDIAPDEPDVVDDTTKDAVE